MSGAALSRSEIVALAALPAEPSPPAAVPPTPVTRVSSAQTATADALVFAEEERSLHAALASPAAVILVGDRLPTQDDARILRVADPRFLFAVCARELRHRLQAAQSRGDAPVIDPTASVDPSARLGARVRVAAGTVIGANAVLGDDCVLGPNVTIAENVVLGARVAIQAGAVLGSQGFGYVRNKVTGEYLLSPQVGTLVVEDDVEIGANTTIDRGALEETRIGRGTKIDNLVHIGHNCRIGKNVIIAAQVGISGSCIIEDGAILAGQVGISDHCHIGPGVILGGQAGVYRGKSVEGPGEVFAGTPAEPLRDQMRSLAQLRALARKQARAREGR